MGPGVDGPVVVFILRAEARRRKVGLIFFGFPPSLFFLVSPFIYLFGFFGALDMRRKEWGVATS